MCWLCQQSEPTERSVTLPAPTRKSVQIIPRNHYSPNNNNYSKVQEPYTSHVQAVCLKTIICKCFHLINNSYKRKKPTFWSVTLLATTCISVQIHTCNHRYLNLYLEFKYNIKNYKNQYIFFQKYKKHLLRELTK